MNVETVICVILQNPETKAVLIQNGKQKYPSCSFPGGHVEQGESIYDCAACEVKEETRLDVYNLKYCGVVHWANRENNDRYLCFMYKTTEFNGELITENAEGSQFWLSIDELFAAGKEKLSSVHYALSPLFYTYGKYSEVFILHSGDESIWEVSCFFNLFLNIAANISICIDLLRILH